MWNTVVTVWRWELRSFFGRPGGWLILLAATLPAAVAAGWLAALVGRGGLPLRADDDPISQFLGPNLFLLGTLLWLVPLLTMNLIADDRRRGAWELLVTSPAETTAVVVAKFLGAWTLLSICLAPWPLFLAMFRLWNGKATTLAGWVPWFAGPGIAFEFGLWLGGTLGLVVIAATLSAVGTLLSAISRRPVTAALATAACLGLLVAASLLPRVLEQWRVPAQQWDWLQPLAIWGHLAEFSRGTIPVARVLQHASLTILLLWSASQLCRRVDG